MHPWVRDDPEQKRPTEEACAIGRYLAEFPPEDFRDRFSEQGWAVIADAVWSAEDALQAPADGRDMKGGLLP